MADQWDGLIIGAGIAAIVTVVVSNWFEKTPWGGGTPNQTAVPSYNAKGGVLLVEEPCTMDMYAAPLAQNTPITEAAYNAQPVPGGYMPAFGNGTNAPQPNNEAVLTI
jgi:hypothetical protein